MNPEIPVDLVSQIQAGRCIVFVGMGASLPPPGRIGPPGSALLTVELIDQLGYAPDNGTLPWVAQLFEQQAGPQRLRSLLRDRYNHPGYQPTLAHCLIARVQQFRTIVSTTFDELLDRELTRNGAPFPVVVNDNDLLPPGERQLVKLFGFASQPQTLRITETDLEAFLARRGGIADLLQVLGRTATLLFLGYRLDDVTFHRLYWDLRLDAGDQAPAAYLVQDNVDPLEIAFWKERKLIPLIGPLEDFLCDLQARLGGEPLALDPTDLPQPDRLDEATLHEQSDRLIRFLALMGIGGSAETRLELGPTAQRHRGLVLAALQEFSLTSGLTNVSLAGRDIQSPFDRAQILVRFALAEWSDRNHAEARRHFDEALRLWPDDAATHLNLHYLLAEMGELSSALDSYRLAVSLDPRLAVFGNEYEVLEILGTDVLGVTYRVRCAGDPRDLTAKALRSGIAQDSEALERFRQFVAPLAAPGIPALVASGKYNGRFFLVREYAQGVTLARRLAAGPLPAREAFVVLERLAGVLELAHALDRPHLQLSPSVVMLGADGSVHVLAFGETVLLSGQPQLAVSLREHTPYRAPEQAADHLGSAASDRYALGGIAYALFTGHEPGFGALEPASHLNSEVDEAADVLIARARAFEPTRRFDDTAQMRREIQHIGLLDRPGGLVQTVRWALLRLSRVSQALFATRRHREAFYALLALAALAEVAQLGRLPRTLTRSWLELSVAVVLATALSAWWVADTARNRGLGSLMHSARGMGLSFGVLLAAWQLNSITFQTVIQTPTGLVNRTTPHPIADVARGHDFVVWLGASILFTLLLTFAMLLVSHLAGMLTLRTGKRFMSGFYWAFLVTLLLVLLLTVLRLPFGWAITVDGGA